MAKRSRKAAALQPVDVEADPASIGKEIADLRIEANLNSAFNFFQDQSPRPTRAAQDNAKCRGTPRTAAITCDSFIQLSVIAYAHDPVDGHDGDDPVALRRCTGDLDDGLD